MTLPKEQPEETHGDDPDLIVRDEIDYNVMLYLDEEGNLDPDYDPFRKEQPK